MRYSGSTHCEKMMALRLHAATSLMSAIQLFQFGTLSGAWIEVADLAEPP